MDSTSENTQGPPRATISSARRNFRSPIAYLIILCLRYLGCDIERIFAVLQSYDLGGTIFDVSRHIEEDRIRQYHEYGVHPDGRKIYPQSSGDIITIDVAEQRPVLLVVSSTRISTLFAREIVSASTPDGRKILTIINEGELRCCSWDGVDFSIHMG